MGDDEARPALHQLDHALLDVQLGAGVHRAGGLVQHEQPRGGEHRPGNGDELPLALAQVCARLHQGRVVALRQALDCVRRAGKLSRAPHLLLGCIRLPVEDVLPHRSREKPAVLQHHAEGATQAGPGVAADVDAVDQDGTRGDLVETRKEVDDGGLAGARVLPTIAVTLPAGAVKVTSLSTGTSGR